MVCDTCDHCPGDEETDSKAAAKIAEFMQEHHEHGIQCGLEIANLVKEIHPRAVAVIPLYRSCIAVVQSDEESKDGTATIHAYADPRWLGGEINIETLKLDRFHKVFSVQGLRDGPEIFSIDIEEGECGKAAIHVDTKV